MTVLTVDPRVSFRVNLAAIPGVAGLSRHWLTQLLDLWGVDKDSTETALLLVSELVTNAARASGRITGTPTPLPGETVSTVIVRARVSMTHLRVEVWDNSPSLPTVKHVDEDCEDGRGLFLVAELAEEWGCEPFTIPPRESPGKIVYFLLKLPRPPEPRSARPAEGITPHEVITTPSEQQASPAVPPQRPQPAPALPRRPGRPASQCKPKHRTAPDPLGCDTSYAAMARLRTALLALSRDPHPRPAKEPICVTA